MKHLKTKFQAEKYFNYTQFICTAIRLGLSENFKQVALTDKVLYENCCFEHMVIWG